MERILHYQPLITMLLRLSHLIFGSSKSELQQLQEEGVPLTYEQKIKGDRMTTILLMVVTLVITLFLSFF